MDSTDLRSFEVFIRPYLDTFCKASRVKHSVSVATLASTLCARFGVNPGRGFAAGLAHDLMKDRPLPEQWGYARRAKEKGALKGVAEAVSRIDGEETFADKIIHGPAASVFLFENGGLEDLELLEAIALHSSASTTMSPLAKIVFVADKMEPQRPYMFGRDIASAEALDLDRLLIEALRLSIDWLEGKNHAIAQSTLDLYNALTMREKS